MYIKRVSLSNFRNFSEQELIFDAPIVVFTGLNGSGKTNLLEAASTLCLGRSERLNSTDTTLIKSGSDFYRLQGEIESDSQESIATVSFQTGRGKKVTLDNQPVKISELFRRFSVVSLFSEDSGIISGTPSLRRRFLDFHLSQVSADYLEEATIYQRVLAQRNSHLKEYGLDNNGTPFDELLIIHGSRITYQRQEFLSFIGDCGEMWYKTISSNESFSCKYHPSAVVSSSQQLASGEQELSCQDIAERFQKRLSSRQAAEATRATTLVGPHRDDFSLEISNLPARTHASQGQWRSAAIAIKLAAFDYLRKKRWKNNSAPVLMLDEVFAELDAARQQALLHSLSNYGQLFVTTALHPPESLTAQAAIYKVDRGTVKRVQ